MPIHSGRRAGVVQVRGAVDRGANPQLALADDVRRGRGRSPRGAADQGVHHHSDPRRSAVAPRRRPRRRNGEARLTDSRSASRSRASVTVSPSTGLARLKSSPFARSRSRAPAAATADGAPAPPAGKHRRGGPRWSCPPRRVGPPTTRSRGRQVGPLLTWSAHRTGRPRRRPPRPRSRGPAAPDEAIASLDPAPGEVRLGASPRPQRRSRTSRAGRSSLRHGVGQGSRTAWRSDGQRSLSPPRERFRSRRALPRPTVRCAAPSSRGAIMSDAPRTPAKACGPGYARAGAAWAISSCADPVPRGAGAVKRRIRCARAAVLDRAVGRRLRVTLTMGGEDEGPRRLRLRRLARGGGRRGLIRARCVVRRDQGTLIEPQPLKVQVWGLSRERRERLTRQANGRRSSARIARGRSGASGALPWRPAGRGPFGLLLSAEAMEVRHHREGADWRTEITAQDGRFAWKSGS